MIESDSSRRTVVQSIGIDVARNEEIGVVPIRDFCSFLQFDEHVGLSSHGCENTLQTDNPPSLSSAVVAVAGSEAVVEELKQTLLKLGADSVESRDLVEENWEENWKQFFKPRRVGQRFIVRPTWESSISPIQKQ